MAAHTWSSWSTSPAKRCSIEAASTYTDLAAAVDALDAAGLDFGDLRLRNVTCILDKAVPGSSARPEDEKPRVQVKLVDFDWAGMARVDRYPATLDDSLPDWAAGIKRYGVVCTEHDCGMLRRMEKTARARGRRRTSVFP